MDHGAESYRRYLAGEDIGLMEIIRDYKDGLILFLCRYVHDLHTAEELAEETFFRLAVRKPRFLPRSSFKTWLYTIGRNQALNHLKRAGRHAPLEEAEQLAEPETAEASLLREEQNVQLHRALSGLQDTYSQVLYLKYFEDMTNGQIASVMKKNKRQIENLLYQAKRALKSALEQEGFAYEDL